MYLHEDRDTFSSIIEQVSNERGKSLIIVEKDYYVTLILKLLGMFPLWISSINWYS